MKFVRELHGGGGIRIGEVNDDKINPVWADWYVPPEMDGWTLTLDDHEEDTEEGQS